MIKTDKAYSDAQKPYREAAKKRVVEMFMKQGKSQEEGEVLFHAMASKRNSDKFPPRPSVENRKK